MTIRLYLDEDTMSRDLVLALRSRAADIITALDADMIARTDEEHLIYATAHNRALYSFNAVDYCRLHTSFLTQGLPHAGIILTAQGRYSTGEQMRRLLKLIAMVRPDDIRNQLVFLGAWG